MKVLISILFLSGCAGMDDDSAERFFRSVNSRQPSRGWQQYDYVNGGNVRACPGAAAKQAQGYSMSYDYVRGCLY